MATTSGSNNPEEARPPEVTLAAAVQHRKYIANHRKNADGDIGNSTCRRGSNNNQQQSSMSTTTTSVIPNSNLIKSTVAVMDVIDRNKELLNSCHKARRKSVLRRGTAWFPRRRISCITGNYSSERNLPELLCPSSPKLSVIQVPETTSYTPKSRNSMHLDVNEALSSLLWQPYEYQNAASNDNNGNAGGGGGGNYSLSSSGSSSSSSSSSGSCTSLCSTSHTGSSGSSTSSTGDLEYEASVAEEQYVNTVLRRDLHLDVNNPSSKQRQRRAMPANSGWDKDSGGAEEELSSLSRRRRRAASSNTDANNAECLALSAAAYLPFSYSGAGVPAVGAFVAPLLSYSPNVNAFTSSLTTTSEYTSTVSCPNGTRSMRAELPLVVVPTSTNTTPIVVPSRHHNTIEITTANHRHGFGTSSSTNNPHGTMVVLPPPRKHAPQNLSTANVVGLPPQSHMHHHARQSSIPNSTPRPSAGPTVMFPNHPRTASEPATSTVPPLATRYNNRQHPSSGGTLFESNNNNNGPFVNQVRSPSQHVHIRNTNNNFAMAQNGGSTLLNVPSDNNNTMVNVRNATVDLKGNIMSPWNAAEHLVQIGSIAATSSTAPASTSMKKDFSNTPQQRAPLDLSINSMPIRNNNNSSTTMISDHLNIVHHRIPSDSVNKPQLSVTHQRTPSDFNPEYRQLLDSSAPSQLNITHQRTVSDIAQSSTVRNDLMNKTPPNRMIDNNLVALLHHQRTPSIPSNNNNSIHSQMLELNNFSQHQRSNSNPANNRGVAPLNNVSNVNVNYYRAVPVNVVSAVPTIHCVNTASTTTTNVSNVNIVQAMSPLGTAELVPTQSISTLTSMNNVSSTNTNNQEATTTRTTTSTTEVIVHSSHEPPSVHHHHQPVTRTRTFTSTEAQTDDISAVTQTIITPPAAPVDMNSITTVVGAVPDAKEQRRRERRERKHQRRMNSNNHRHSGVGGTGNNDRLPDILNSHLPPPYSTMPGHGGGGGMAMLPPPPLPPPPNAIMVPAAALGAGGMLHHHQGLVPSVGAHGAAMVPYHAAVLPGQVPLVQQAVVSAGAPPGTVVQSPTGFRFPFPTSGFRRSRYSEEPPKGCCGLLAWKPGSLRWFIALIALVAVCCVLVGTALGAMRPAGRDHLTVSLLMIGVGIVLVTVSGVAWRLTAHDTTTSCRTMLGLGAATSSESINGTAAGGASGGGDLCSRRFVPRLPPAYGRPHHPYAAMMYPEFQYRAPPPSYQASMQEYRLRLLLLDRSGNGPTGVVMQQQQREQREQVVSVVPNGGVVSPPPMYRSNAGSLLRSTLNSTRHHHQHHRSTDTTTNQSEYSCPPSYRSQNSLARPAPAIPLAGSIGRLSGTGVIQHSRDPSLTHSDHTNTSNNNNTNTSIPNNNNNNNIVNVVSILNHHHQRETSEDSIKLESPNGVGVHEFHHHHHHHHHVRLFPKQQDSEGNNTEDELVGKDGGNLVTIVQTTGGGGGGGVDVNHHHHHHVMQSPMIVTVSGSGNVTDSSAAIDGGNIQITEIAGEMEILAHL